MNAIVGSGNHYVLQAKGNQPRLQGHIAALAAGALPADVHTVDEKAHGRHTTWVVKVYRNHDAGLRGEWAGLDSFIVVERAVAGKQGHGGTSVSRGTAYWVSDLRLGAAEFAAGIRGHWGIENRLHWVKDVCFGEDANGIRDADGAVNMAVFSTISINFLRQNISDSVRQAQILFGQNFKELFHKIRN